MPRPMQTPPDCSICPKKSPDNEPNVVLNQEGLATLVLWRMSRATGGRGLTEAEATDEWLVYKLGLIDAVMASIDRNRQSETVLDMAMLVHGGGKR